MQIIIGALAAGVATFAGVMIFVGQGGNAGAQPREPFFAYIGVGFAALAIVLWIIVPRLAVGNIGSASSKAGQYQANHRLPTEQESAT